MEKIEKLPKNGIRSLSAHVKVQKKSEICRPLM